MAPLTLTPQDQEQLKILRICHFIWGGLIAFFGLFGLLYVVFGGAIAVGALPTSRSGEEAAPAIAGTILIVAGLLVTALSLAIAGLNIWSGMNLGKAKSRTLSMIVAGLNCLSIPIGTTLGVFTLMVLSRPTVRAAYEQNALVRA